MQCIRKEAFFLPTYARELSNLRLAVLIDAENVPRKCIKSVVEEIAIYGTPTIKRIYGDWTSATIGGWKHSLLENAITPIQQYSYTAGKNSSDSAMIIDAMDILYTERTDGFVIVSSDSDFTRLAIRLREAGQRVIGIGEKKTPSAFIAACDKFIYIEVIRAKARGQRQENDDNHHEAEDGAASIESDTASYVQENGNGDYYNTLYGQSNANANDGDDSEDADADVVGSYDDDTDDEDDIDDADLDAAKANVAKKNKNAAARKKHQQQNKSKQKNQPPPAREIVEIPNSVIELIADSLADLADDNGFVFLAELGNLILKKMPNFDSRNYGHKSLSAMFKSMERFETDFRQTGESNVKHVYVRDRQRTD